MHNLQISAILGKSDVRWSSKLFTQYNYHYFVICNGIFWRCILVTVKINDRFVGFFETSTFEVFLCVKFVFESKVLPLVYWRKCFVSQLFWNLHSLLILHYFVPKKHKKTTGKNPSFYLFVKIAKVCWNFARCNAVVWNSTCTALLCTCLYKSFVQFGQAFNFRQKVLHQTAAFAIIRQARRLLPQRRWFPKSGRQCRHRCFRYRPFCKWRKVLHLVEA